MVIAFNARLILPGTMDGIAWYMHEIGRRLPLLRPNDSVVFLFDRAFIPEMVPAGVHAVRIGLPARHPYLWHLWYQWSVPRALRALKADVLVSLDGFIPLSTEVPTVVVLHDIAFEHDAGHVNSRTVNYYKRFFPQSARNATCLGTVSEAARDDISATYGVQADLISVIPNGVRDRFFQPAGSSHDLLPASIAGGAPYFLHVGTIQPRKNVVRLIAAFERFCLRNTLPHHLVLAGKIGWMSDDVTNAIERSEHKHRIHLLGFTEDSALAELYRNAAALTFVPLYEGFGVPIVEAFATGTPVITSNRNPMVQVAAGAACLVDPEDVAEIASAMERVISDAEYTTRLRNRGLIRAQAFSWDASAAIVSELIDRAVAIRKPYVQR